MKESLLYFKTVGGAGLYMEWSPKATKGVLIWRKDEKSERSLFAIFDKKRAILTPPFEEGKFLCWWGEDPLIEAERETSGKKQIKLLVQRKAPVLEEVFTFPLDYEFFSDPSFVVGNILYFRAHPKSIAENTSWFSLNLEKKSLQIASEIPPETVGALPGPDSDSVILEEVAKGTRSFSLFKVGGQIQKLRLNEDLSLRMGIWLTQSDYLFLDLKEKGLKTAQSGYDVYLLALSEKGATLKLIGSLEGLFGINGLAISQNLSTLWCIAERRQIAPGISISGGAEYSEVDELIEVKIPYLLAGQELNRSCPILVYVILGIVIFGVFLILSLRKLKPSLKTKK
ncbi:MAG: hypothetical protein QMD88_09180 [Coprothermobacterota bacterium]|nr:hypothetical protein [Coprothermobacterota bacterium]